MDDHAISEISTLARNPWNKGKLTGAKPPLQPRHVWSIRSRLEADGRVRDQLQSFPVSDVIVCFYGCSRPCTHKSGA